MVTARVTRDYCIHGCYKDSLQGFYPGLFSLGDEAKGLFIVGRCLVYGLLYGLGFCKVKGLFLRQLVRRRLYRVCSIMLCRVYNL